MTRKKKPQPNAEAFEAVANSILSEAERIMGVTGPKLTVMVDGHMYRLMTHPEIQPAKAAALYAEMAFMIRSWLGKNPAIANEINQYPIPSDDQIRAFPMPITMSIYLGLGLEIFAHKQGVTIDDIADGDIPPYMNG